MNDMLDTLPTVATKPQSAAGAALVAREAQEVQAMVISAKRFPRDQRAAFDRIMQACARPSLAEEAEYAYPKGGETITGPTIRLLEVCAQNWGNCHAGIKVLSADETSSEVEAFCWDFETNYRDTVTFRVSHIRDTKKGPVPLTSERDIYEVVANMGARRKRRCLENVIPGDIVEAARQECNKTLGSMAEKKEKVVAMIKAFQDDFRVTRDDIERRIGKRIEAMTTPEFVQLKKIYVSLRDKMSQVADWFPQVLDPEKLKAAQNEAGPALETPSEKAATDADKRLAIDEFQKAVAGVRKVGGDPEKVMGKRINDVLLGTAADIGAAADALSLWEAPKA